MRPAKLNYLLNAMNSLKAPITPARFVMKSTENNNAKIPMLHIFFEAEDFGHRRIDEHGEWDGQSWNYDIDNLEGEDFPRELIAA